MLNQEALPENIPELHVIINSLSLENLRLKEIKKEQLLLIAELEEKLKKMRIKQFGKSSEKVNRATEDLEHSIEETEIQLSIKNEFAFGDNEASTKSKPKRQKIAESIPREDIVVDAPKKCTECGGENFRKIGEDISEVLEYIPASFKAIKYIRPRCICKDCETLNQAYPVSKGIDKGKAGFGLLSHIIVQKYCNHLPLYRQSQMYERESSIDISRSTMCSWLGQCSKLLNPLVDELRKSVFSAEHLHGDDTPVKVLDPTGGKTKIGRIWTYVVDGRPHGDESPAAVCYYYSPDRKAIRPESHLSNFKGVLHADAYAGYNKVYITEDHPNRGVYEAACWAHLRRKFYEITVSTNNAHVAYTAIEEIRKLYQVEKSVRGKAPEERLAARQKYSKQLVEDLFKGFKSVLSKLPQKSSTALAIRYALNNEDALKRFVENGKIEINNNAAERALRSVAIGRKNWMFAGSDIGGETAANMYSLIETAKLNGINPWEYLKKVLSVIQDYKSTKLADLLPWNIQWE